MDTILPFSHILLVLCILLPSAITTNNNLCAATRPRTNHPSSTYIKKSCHTTLYPRLCNRTLAVFAKKIKTNPKILAMTALLVTINTTRSASKRLRHLSGIRALKPGEKEALIECVEEVGDSVYELRKAMKGLNHSRRGPEFGLRMNDVQTWVSAALTDDDTCVDDFMTSGRVRILVQRLVRRIARLTSIALAFINNYAAL